MKNEFPKLIFKRLLSSVLVLFLLVSFIFILVRLAPGDPTQKFLSPKLSPELSQQVYKSFGLDQPIYVQYFSFIKNAFKGDFGISYTFRQSVLSVIKKYFLFTLLFSSLSFILQLIFGYYFAKTAFKSKNKFFDKTISKLFLFIYSIPSFVIGVACIYIFAVKLNLLPTSGIKSIYSSDTNFFSQLFDYSIHLILPLITLSLAGVAVYYKYLRDNLVSLANQPFIINLRAMGVPEKEIFNKHLVPNAIQPLISVAGIEFGVLLGGALITEVIFALPGMGRLTVNAILSRDFPLVIGCSFIAGLMMIFSNFAADLIKIKIDKRLTKELID